jgi:hypothetical protein
VTVAQGFGPCLAVPVRTFWSTARQEPIGQEYLFSC